MSYETVTLRDCGPACCQVMPTHSRFTSLGIVPIAALGLKTIGKAVIGKVVSGIFGGTGSNITPEQRAIAAARSPEQKAADFAATMTAFRAAGAGTALDRVMGRKMIIGKVPRGMNPLTPTIVQPSVVSAPLVPAGPVVTMEPVPSRGSQAMMMVPTSMAESGPASGGGAESEATTSTAPAAPASGLAPLLIGGLLLFAFSRRKRQR